MRGIAIPLTVTVLLPLILAQDATPVVPTYAPIPSTGMGPNISQDLGYRVEALGEGAYMITDGVYQSMFLVSTESVIAVDAPPTIGHNILKGIRTVTDLPISHLIYSHAHADHIGGAYTLLSPYINTTIIAHEETAKELQASVDNARPMPNVTFCDQYYVTADNQTLELSYKGSNHEPGNIFIYAPVPKILMVVDIVYPGWVPFSKLAESQNIPGWITAHDQILEYDFDYYIGGHINRWGTREDVLIQKEYMMDLYNNCVEAIVLSSLPPNATNTLSYGTSLMGIEAANPGNAWAATTYYVDDLLTGYCNNKTNEKWLGRLAGADVYGPSNAATLVESLRIDFGILGPVGVTN